MSGQQVPEELGKFLAALVEDEELRDWFESLAGDSYEERCGMFLQTAARMGEAQEHPEMIAAIVALAEPGAYETIQRALDDAPQQP